jgi:hypothetical protein
MCRSTKAIAVAESLDRIHGVVSKVSLYAYEEIDSKPTGKVR